MKPLCVTIQMKATEQLKVRTEACVHVHHVSFIYIASKLLSRAVCHFQHLEDDIPFR